MLRASSAARAQGLAEGQTQVDIALFIQWVNATARDEPELADFYEQRFRPEFVPAFDAWQDTDPLTNPEAPPTPFAMPEYQLESRTEAEQLDAQSEVASAAGPPQHPAIRQLRSRCRPLCSLPILRGHEHQVEEHWDADGVAHRRLPGVRGHRGVDRHVPDQPQCEHTLVTHRVPERERSGRRFASRFVASWLQRDDFSCRARRARRRGPSRT